MKECKIEDITTWGISIEISTWGTSFEPWIDLMTPEHSHDDGMTLTCEEALTLAEALKSAVAMAEVMVKEEA